MGEENKASSQGIKLWRNLTAHWLRFGVPQRGDTNFKACATQYLLEALRIGHLFSSPKRIPDLIDKIKTKNLINTFQIW